MTHNLCIVNCTQLLVVTFIFFLSPSPAHPPQPFGLPCCAIGVLCVVKYIALIFLYITISYMVYAGNSVALIFAIADRDRDNTLLLAPDS